MVSHGLDSFSLGYGLLLRNYGITVLYLLLAVIILPTIGKILGDTPAGGIPEIVIMLVGIPVLIIVIFGPSIVAGFFRKSMERKLYGEKRV